MILYAHLCSLKSEIEFAIIAVYIDEKNLIRTPDELSKTVEYLKKEFEVKDLDKIKLCLGLKLEHKKTESLSINQLILEKYLSILTWINLIT